MDSIPFSLVEWTLWMGGVATLLWIVTLFIKKEKNALRLFAKLFFWFGPVTLFALGLGQGAFPFSLAPSAWRTPLATKLGTDSLLEFDFRSWTEEKEIRLNNHFNWRRYYSLSPIQTLSVCDHSLDTVLAQNGLLPGRSVRNFKDMGPLCSALGMIYGGPAFHDPFYGEIGIIKASIYPTSLHWRNIAVCHETAHAKGFTREIDAEILTQMALQQAGKTDDRFLFLADIHFLEKTGISTRWPKALSEELQRVQVLRKEVQNRQPIINRLRHWAVILHLRNSPKKYGDRESQERWNPRHPFFSLIHRLEAHRENQPKPNP